MGSDRPHIVVIGAGIVGICTAAYLLRNGCQVTLVDRRGPGEATSFGNAGGISSSSATPLAMPGIWKKVPTWLTDPDGPLKIRPSYAHRVAPWLISFLRHSSEANARGNSAALYTLNRGSVKDLMPLVQWANLQHLIVVPANLTLYRSKTAYDAARLTHELRDATGHPYEVIDAQTIRKEEPELAPDFNVAIRSPDNGFCRNPLDLSVGLAEKICAEGVSLLRREVQGLDIVDGRLKAVRTDREAIAFDGAVIAAGVWSKHFMDLIGHRVLLESQRGYHVSVKNPNVTLNNVQAVGDKKVSVTPMSSGLRISGTVEFSGTESLPDRRRGAALLPILQQLVPRLKVEETTEWSGHRPCTPDSLPVIGRSSKVGNIYFGFGHGHQGLMGAAPTGRILSEIILGRDPGVDVSPFSADRF